MFREVKTIVLLLLCALLLSVVFASSCTRTTKEVITHDTIFVAAHYMDSTSTIDVAHENNFVSKSDTIIKTKSDTVFKTISKTDSIFIKDSIYIKEKGDSVFIYKEKWNTKYIDRHDTILSARVDTVYRFRTDTIYKTKTDTLRIYRFIERNDSTHKATSSNTERVKQNRTLSWLKWLAVAIVAFAVVGWLVRAKRKM